MKIGFIGLGHMGSGMAGRLLAAGHGITVYNRTAARTRPLAERGARVAASVHEVASSSDVLVTMLSDDRAVESVVLGENGVVSGLPHGSIHASASTISPALSRRLSRAHEDAGQQYVAAPVLGRPDAAEAGNLVIVTAGALAAVDRCRPLFDAMGKEVHILGEMPERANVVKLGVNFVLAVLLEALGEAFTLCEGYGVEAARFLDILNGSLLKSPALETYGRKIAEQRFEPGFRLELGAKDVRLAVEAAEHRATPTPIARALLDRFVAAMAEGHADEDWSAVGRISSHESHA